MHVLPVIRVTSDGGPAASLALRRPGTGGSAREEDHVTATPVLQRLVQLTTMLTAAGDRGWPALDLADALGYGGVPESRREALARDIRSLRRVGIDIGNIADEGSESRWVLRPRDIRVQLEFPAEELAELSRAAVLAGRSHLARGWGGTAAPGRDPLQWHTVPPPRELDQVLRAVSARCVLTFTYNGRPREVVPSSVASDSGGWSLTGFDATRGEVRTFYVHRMTVVEVGAPGTAGTDTRQTRTSTDPLRWEVDEPCTAVLRSPRVFAPDVAALLGAAQTPGGDSDSAGADDPVQLTAVVTNTLVFLARLLELGTRVELLEPQSLRDALDRRFLRPEGWSEAG